MKIVVASQHKDMQTQDLLTIENTDSDLKVHAPHYVNELLVRVRLAFQKLLQTRQTSRNNIKPCKQILVMINHFFGNSEITRYQSEEQTQKVTRTTTLSLPYVT